MNGVGAKIEVAIIVRKRGFLKGAAHIAGLRLTTREVFDRFMIGGGLEDLAREWAPLVTVRQLEAAIRYECAMACRCKDCRWARQIRATP